MPTHKVRTLYFASNPAQTQLLRLDEEVRLITEKLRASDFRDTIEFKSLWAVRPDDLLQALNEHKPVIVHFSGHGNLTGEIILMDSSGQPKSVSVAALKGLFRTLKDNIRVVVLNACYSKTQATAISEVIDCVVGMSSAISDDAAILFVSSFYRAIGFGRSVKEAFEQGIVSLLLEGMPEEDIPELIVRAGIDSASIMLLGSEIRQSELPVSAPQSFVSEDKPENVRNQATDDLAKLEDLLSRAKWREADIETSERMREEAGLSIKESFSQENIDNFSSDYLEKIDRLWMKHSKGCYGFSVQTTIWQKAGGSPKAKDTASWYKFADLVSWRKNLKKWISKQELIYDSSIPLGYLPFWGRWLWEDRIEAGAEWRNIQKALGFLSLCALDIPSQVVSEDVEYLPIDDLSSDRGVSYKGLSDFLVMQQWEKANHETIDRMLEAIGESTGGELSMKNLVDFPLIDLNTIDKLWTKYSNGRFGFSIQYSIYQECLKEAKRMVPPDETRMRYDEDYFRTQMRFYGATPDGWAQDFLAERVGWLINSGGQYGWLTYSEFKFSDFAPKGHLPILGSHSRWDGKFKPIVSGYLPFLKRLRDLYTQDRKGNS